MSQPATAPGVLSAPSALRRPGAAAASVLAVLALLAAPAAAQTGDAVNGKALFGQALVAGRTETCIGCHDVFSRRALIAAGSSSWEAISIDEATGAFDQAIRADAGGFMGRYRGPLNAQQFLDIAAYLADTPRFSGDGSDDEQFDFNVAAVGDSAAQPVTLSHQAAPDADLRVVRVFLEPYPPATAVSGAFSLTTTACAGQTLAARLTCTDNVRFSPASAGVKRDLLAFELEVGQTRFTRRVVLQGTVGSAPPPAPAAPSNQGGGGALGWGWLAALGLAAVGAWRARRR